jgi:tetratricopeptide (TPR) repeat protein
MEPFTYKREFEPGVRLCNLSLEMLRANRGQEALACAIAACLLKPERSEPWVALAAGYDKFPGLEREQVDACLRGLDVNQTDCLALHNLSLAQMRLYQWPEALESSNRAHQIDRTNPYFLVQASSILSQMGQRETAISLMTSALQLFAGSRLDDGGEDARKFKYQIHTARALAELERGNLTQYFADHRRRAEYDKEGSFIHTAWQADRLWSPGDPISSKILLFMEDGLGDQIQFARLIRSLPTVEDLVCVCSSTLKDLLHPMVDDVIDREKDAQAQLRYLGKLGWTIIAVSDLPELSWGNGKKYPFGRWEGPYLHPGAIRRPELKSWSPQREYSTDGLPKTSIGFCWRGNPFHPYDWARSLKLEQFLAWAETKRGSCTFHNLQLEADHHQVTFPPWVEDCSPVMGDMHDTGAMLKQLDVVIGPDTSLIHLAGAMGTPAVVLHAYRKDWRWTLPYPIYGPTLKQITQETPGDWDGVFDRLGPTLNALNQELRVSELAQAMQPAGAGMAI